MGRGIHRRHRPPVLAHLRPDAPRRSATARGDHRVLALYVRDIAVEAALRRRWNRYILGYDLRQQIHIFESVTTEYETFRKGSNLDKGALGKLTRPPALAAILGLGFVAAYALWKRRRLAAVATAKKPKEAVDRELATATLLYRALRGARSPCNGADATGVLAPVATRRGPVRARASTTSETRGRRASLTCTSRRVSGAPVSTTERAATSSVASKESATWRPAPAEAATPANRPPGVTRNHRHGGRYAPWSAGRSTRRPCA